MKCDRRNGNKPIQMTFMFSYVIYLCRLPNNISPFSFWHGSFARIADWNETFIQPFWLWLWSFARSIKTVSRWLRWILNDANTCVAACRWWIFYCALVSWKFYQRKIYEKLNEKAIVREQIFSFSLTTTKTATTLNKFDSPWCRWMENVRWFCILFSRQIYNLFNVHVLQERCVCANVISRWVWRFSAELKWDTH